MEHNAGLSWSIPMTANIDSESKNRAAKGATPDPIIETYLLCSNVENEIHMYLLNHGSLMDTKTRVFLANLRDVMGAMARRVREGDKPTLNPPLSTSASRLKID